MLWALFSSPPPASAPNVSICFYLVTYYLHIYVSMCYKQGAPVTDCAYEQCYKVTEWLYTAHSYSIWECKYLGSRQANIHYTLVNMLCLYVYICFGFSLNMWIIKLILWHNCQMIISTLTIYLPLGLSLYINIYAYSEKNIFFGANL